MFTSLALMLVVSAAPAVEGHYGLADAQLKEAAFNCVVSSLWVPITKEMKALPPGARVAAVKTLGSLVKAWYASDDFKKRYAQWRTDGAPPTPAPIRPAATIQAERLKEARAEYDKSVVMVKKMPKENQAEMKKAFDDSLKGQEEMLKDKDMLGAMEKMRFDSETQNVAEWATAHPEDANVKLKEALNNALKATEGIDFNAKIKDRHFVNREFEGKNSDWKRCFRAGKDACEATRAFAKEWLAELK